MIVAFANNQTMITEGGGATSIIKTDPYPVGSANFGEAVLNVHKIFKTGGTTATLYYKVEGSNDGQTWFDVPNFDDDTTTENVEEEGQDVTCVFIRVEFKLLLAGGAGTDIAAATFDLHVNLIRK